MEKSERHHIKENDFQLIIERGYDWLQKYKREVFYGIGIVVAMVVLWYGWNAFSGSRESHASQLLAQALGGDKVDMEKVKRVASKYSGLPAGRSAQALLAIQEGKAPKETAAALEDLVPKVKDATFKGVLIFNSVLLTAEGGFTDNMPVSIRLHVDACPVTHDSRYFLGYFSHVATVIRAGSPVKFSLDRVGDDSFLHEDIDLGAFDDLERS